MKRRSFLKLLRKTQRLDRVFSLGGGRNDTVILGAAHGTFLFVIFTFIVSHEDRDNEMKAYAKSNLV